MFRNHLRFFFHATRKSVAHKTYVATCAHLYTIKTTCYIKMTNAPDMSIKKHLRVFRKDAQQIIYLSLKKTKKKQDISWTKNETHNTF
jgi:hypothetical protein